MAVNALRVCSVSDAKASTKLHRVQMGFVCLHGCLSQYACGSMQSTWCNRMSARLKAAPAKHRNNPLTAPTVYSLNRMADLCLDLKKFASSRRS